jgi:hypothetical protein
MRSFTNLNTITTKRLSILDQESPATHHRQGIKLPSPFKKRYSKCIMNRQCTRSSYSPRRVSPSVKGQFQESKLDLAARRRHNEHAAMVIASVMSSPLLSAPENDSLSSEQFDHHAIITTSNSNSGRPYATNTATNVSAPSSSSGRILSQIVLQQQARALEEQQAAHAASKPTPTSMSTRRTRSTNLSESCGGLEAISENGDIYTTTGNTNINTMHQYMDAGPRTRMVKMNREAMKNKMDTLARRGSTDGGSISTIAPSTQHTNKNRSCQQQEPAPREQEQGPSQNNLTAVDDQRVNHNSACDNNDLALQMKRKQESGRISEHVYRMTLEKNRLLEEELQEMKMESSRQHDNNDDDVSASVHSSDSGNANATSNEIDIATGLQEALDHIEIAERQLMECELQTLRQTNRALEAQLQQLIVSEGDTQEQGRDHQHEEQALSQAEIMQARAQELSEARDALHVAQAAHRRDKKIWQKEKKSLQESVLELESVILEQAQACQRQQRMHKNEMIALLDNSMHTRSMGRLQSWKEEYDEDGDDEDDDEVVSSCKTAPVTGISNDKKKEEQ